MRTFVGERSTIRLSHSLQQEMVAMSYQTNGDLPPGIRDRLTEGSQSFYRIAFNSAIQWYGEESKAHKIAWSAVRNQSVSLNSAILS